MIVTIRMQSVKQKLSGTDSRRAFRASSSAFSKAENQCSTISRQLCKRRGIETDNESALLANCKNAGDRLS